MNILKLWFGAIATTIANPVALLVFAIIYAVLLVASYLFISIREATIWQVLITYALMILIPIGFFTLQASIINRVLDQKFRWRVILIDALKFLAVTIPVLLVVWLLFYLLNKVSARYPAPVVAVPPVNLAAPPTTQTPPTTPALHWPSLFFTTLRFVLLGVAFPLATIHLWIAIAGGEFRTLFKDGAKSFFKRIGSALARAFSSHPVLIYGLGLIIFFVLPYITLIPVFTVSGSKTEFVVFGLRLLLAFLFSLVGWASTLTALARTVPALPTEVSASNVALPTESAA
ncbi:MAG TPA: hypothetical protein VGQ41_13815 [Pyrinomonadaceae bacterium]|jgi:hypothetical protein|nr:hypothetical protein [Pyrinomonadaceae bacterium]